jgi:hypothetical protein
MARRVWEDRCGTQLGGAQFPKILPAFSLRVCIHGGGGRSEGEGTIEESSWPQCQHRQGTGDELRGGSVCRVPDPDFLRRCRYWCSWFEVGSEGSDAEPSAPEGKGGHGGPDTLEGDCSASSVTVPGEMRPVGGKVGSGVTQGTGGVEKRTLLAKMLLDERDPWFEMGWHGPPHLGCALLCGLYSEVRG